MRSLVDAAIIALGVLIAVAAVLAAYHAALRFAHRILGI